MPSKVWYPPGRQARNVEVLWLLTFSAPDAAFDALQPAFEKASASFYVPLEESS
jgi:hypothetical protein